MPRLSIVVARHSAGANILRCLRALENVSENGRAEVIVVDNSDDGTLEALSQRFGEVRFVRAPGSKLIPQLWEEGIRQARGEVVALTTGDFIPEKDWADRILKAHEGAYAGIGGAIENELQGGIVSRAIYFCRYSAYMLPFNESPVEDFAADNGSYKRAILEQYRAERLHGFWESPIHSQMRRDGLDLLLDPKIVVRHQKSFSFAGFMKQRFLHGRQYGADRAKCFSAIRRQLYILMSPAIPIVFLWRITQRVISRKRNFAEYFLALPVLTLFLLSWSAGELMGYLSTPPAQDLTGALARRRA
jgi:GT2 family glycosyltransferase